MQEKAGLQRFKDGSSTRPYIVGDMSSTVYPVNGGMEDWAYAAGWDIYDSNAAMN